MVTLSVAVSLSVSLNLHTDRVDPSLLIVEGDKIPATHALPESIIQWVLFPPAYYDFLVLS